MKSKADNSALLDVLDFGLGSDAVSDTETTGLIPFLPQNEYEEHSYKEINKYRQNPITTHSE